MAVLKPWTTITIAIIAVLGIAIGLGMYLFVQKFMHGYRVEIVNVLDKSAVIAEVLGNYELGGKDFFGYALESSLGMTDAEASKKLAELKKFLGKYGFNYEISLDSYSAVSAYCAQPYSDSHKAIDVSAPCGTVVKAVCKGQLSVASGLSDDPAVIGEEILLLKHDEDCDYKPNYRSFYGCVEFYERGDRTVEQGEGIGTVKTCSKEPNCHLHLSVTKGAVKDAEDPALCNSLDTVIDTGSRVLAKKGELENELEFMVPLVYKNNLANLVIKVER